MLQDVNFIIQFLDRILIALVFELAALPPARILAPGAAAMFLLNAETEEAFQAPSCLVIDESIKELATFDHGAFESLPRIRHVFDVVFIFVGVFAPQIFRG